MKWIVGLSIVVLAALLALYLAYNDDLYVPTSVQESIVIEGGTLFDAVDTLTVVNSSIIIDQGKISCIGKECPKPANAKVIDAEGLTILPGFIDLHVHFFGQTGDHKGLGEMAKVWESVQTQPIARRAMHRHGITTIRSLGDLQSFIYDTKSGLSAGDLEGPRLLTAGPMFTAPGAHPANRDPDGWITREMVIQVDVPAVAKTELQRVANSGATGLKVVYQPSSDLPKMPIDVLFALGEESQRLGLWMAVHSGPTNQEVQTAIEAGADTIEHGVRHGNLIDAVSLDMLLSYNVVYVPTLGREPKGHLNIAALNGAGVPLGVGTDTQGSEMFFGVSFHNELERMVSAGLPHAEALISATRHGAEALGLAHELGTIEAGKTADIVLVSGKPWENIRDSRNVEIVIQNGRFVVLDGNTLN